MVAGVLRASQQDIQFVDFNRGLTGSGCQAFHLGQWCSILFPYSFNENHKRTKIQWSHHPNATSMALLYTHLLSFSSTEVAVIYFRSALSHSVLLLCITCLRRHPTGPQQEGERFIFTTMIVLGGKMREYLSASVRSFLHFFFYKINSHVISYHGTKSV